MGEAPRAAERPAAGWGQPGVVFGDKSLGFTTKAADLDLLLSMLHLGGLLLLSLSQCSAQPQL